MKKIFILLSGILFFSCSQEKIETQNFNTDASVLENGMLSFKNDSTFIKEYSTLSALNSREELDKWALSKKHTSLLSTEIDSLQNNDSIINSKVIYSNAIKTLLNKDSKLKIANKTIWLNDGVFYVLNESNANKNSTALKSLKTTFENYGNLKNERLKGNNSNLRNLNASNNQNSSLSNGKMATEKQSTTVLQVNNGNSISHQKEGPGGKKYLLTLFIERIKLSNSDISKLYVISTMQYRSCSFWRCTWKNDLTRRSVNINVSVDGCKWALVNNVNTTYVLSGIQTILVAKRDGSNIPCLYDNVSITGLITTSSEVAGQFNWFQNI